VTERKVAETGIPAVPRLVAFDLDDTLAPSKSPVDPRMAELFVRLVDRVEVCVISGGQFEQFRTQLLAHLPFPPGASRERLHLLPTCGTQYFRFDGTDWARVYIEALSPDERESAFAILEEEARRLGLWEPANGTETWGPVLEDRGSQVTFSALGQAAPVAAKKAWDPSGARKNGLRTAVAARLPGLEVRSGGSTSIDITRRGIDKAYGMRRLAALTGIGFDDMLFVGDRLDPDGNDFPVTTLGIRCVPVHGWEDTAELVGGLLSGGSAT
jgi:phosphomannomutase